MWFIWSWKENILLSLEVETHQSQTLGAAQEESALYHTVVHKVSDDCFFLVADTRLDLVQRTESLCSLKICMLKS